MFKKSLSQNLIKDGNILKKLVRLSKLEKGDAVVEIGAGQGDLTTALARAGCIVHAIEFDSSFIGILRDLENSFDNLHVFAGNVLDVELTSFHKESPVTVFGNIPYNITGPILFKIVEERKGIDRAFLMVQREVAERVVSPHGRRTYGAVSVIFQLLADVKILLILRPQVFVPPPRVDSAFLAIHFKKDTTEVDGGLIQFIKVCFAHKRKFMSYALRKTYDSPFIDRLYATMKFSANVRAEELEPPVFLTMYRYLKDYERCRDHL